MHDITEAKSWTISRGASSCVKGLGQPRTVTTECYHMEAIGHFTEAVSWALGMESIKTRLRRECEAIGGGESSSQPLQAFFFFCDEKNVRSEKQ